MGISRFGEKMSNLEINRQEKINNKRNRNGNKPKRKA